jgi:folate-binding protein YgfZ
MTAYFFITQPAAVARVTGEDALPYLQSQWSVDLNRLPVLSTRMGLRLSIKGRVLCSAQIICLGQEEFLLVSQETPASEIISLLRENIVADEVDFADETPQWATHFIFGEAAAAIGPCPPPPACLADEEGYIFQDPRFEQPTLTCLHPREEIPHWLSVLDEAEEGQWELHRITNRVARVPLEIGETELPQEGGLEAGLIDFDKGCYLGQEVMARIHAMGKVQRTLIPYSCQNNPGNEIPTPLYNDEGKLIGQIKSAFPHPTEPIWVGMALLNNRALPTFENGGILLNQASLAPLPPAP